MIKILLWIARYERKYYIDTPFMQWYKKKIYGFIDKRYGFEIDSLTMPMNIRKRLCHICDKPHYIDLLDRGKFEGLCTFCKHRVKDVVS